MTTERLFRCWILNHELVKTTQCICVAEEKQPTLKKTTQTQSRIVTISIFTMQIHNQNCNLPYHWTKRRTCKSKRKSPGSFQISLPLEKNKYVLEQGFLAFKLSNIFSMRHRDWSNPFPFYDELLQVFIPRMYYNYRIENRGTRRHIVYFNCKKRWHSATPGQVVLGLPSPTPRVCTDGRWRQNQNFSDQWVTKFAYPWCSASSAINNALIVH